ncbi:hypothetical protein DFH28DRAFT_957302 [Melampsora americana]|nr:hypothetical protein DFH28DRAFT_957302 [Melampsora americana]
MSPSQNTNNTQSINSSTSKPPKSETESCTQDRAKTTHPSFNIIKNKSFGTFMHELWIRYQGEFALSMLETWEVVMLHILLVLLLSFFYMAILRYFPSHVKVIGSRAKYYLSGQE